MHKNPPRLSSIIEGLQSIHNKYGDVQCFTPIDSNTEYGLPSFSYKIYENFIYPLGIGPNYGRVCLLKMKT